VNVTGDRRWAQGSLTNPDGAARREALARIVDCLECARAMNVGIVNLWMGQDGFDYPFEADYARLWEDLVAGLKESADAVPEVMLSVEYKAKEPRVRNIPNSASQTLLAVLAASSPNLRVTLDFGHAILGGENPSQSAAMLAACGRLGHIHMNDNPGDWDWDMAAGVSHWWELVEFCLWLDRLSYTGWLSLDIFPYRADPIAACALCIKATEKARRIAGELKLRGVDEAFEKRDAMAVFGMLMDI
jgi:xylose isomerase